MMQRRTRSRVVVASVAATFLLVGLLAGILVPWRAIAPSGPRSSGEPLAVLAANAGTVWSVSFNPQSDIVAMAVEDGSVRLWDWRKEAIQETFDAHRGVVWSSQLFNGGELLATAGDDGLLKIWSRTRQEPLKVFEHPNAVRGLAIGSDGKLFAGDREGGLHIWSVEASEPRATAQQPGAVYAVAISPDGKTARCPQPAPRRMPGRKR
jgi:WD40 repeat protein